MNHLVSFAAALGLLVTTGMANAQESGAHAVHGNSASSAAAPEMTGASGAYMDAMRQMDEAMAGMEMTGDAGVDFAAMMIPHHQSAIDMAEAYLESEDQDPELTELANEIVASQESEIETLETWLAANR